MENIYSPTYYRILCCAENATQKQIKKNYYGIMLIEHPDVNPNDVHSATEKTIAIMEAYSVLSNPEKKKIYDEGLKNYIIYEQNKKLAEDLKRREEENSKQQQGFNSKNKQGIPETSNDWVAPVLGAAAIAILLGALFGGKE